MSLAELLASLDWADVAPYFFALALPVGLLGLTIAAIDACGWGELAEPNLPGEPFLPPDAVVLVGEVLPAEPHDLLLPVPLFVDPYLGVLPYPDQPVDTPVFDRLHARAALTAWSPLGLETGS